MPRLNIEDAIFKDARFWALVGLQNDDEDKALGLLIRFWREAQEWWGKEGRQLVPEAKFRAGRWQPIADAGLAEKREGGWYARGSEERFKWYATTCDGARKGGAKNKQRFDSDSLEDQPQGIAAGDSLTAKLSLSPLFSSSLEDNNKPESLTAKPHAWEASDPLGKVFSNLCDIPAYRKIFDLKKDTKHIRSHMERDSITLREMEVLSADMALWADSPHAKKVKSWRGTLNTFCKNHVERRASKAQPKGNVTPMDRREFDY